MARKRIPRFAVRQGFDLGWLAIAIGFLIGEDAWGFRAKAVTDDKAGAGDSLAAASQSIETPSGFENADGSLHGSGDGAVFAGLAIAEANGTDPDFIRLVCHPPGCDHAGHEPIGANVLVRH